MKRITMILNVAFVCAIFLAVIKINREHRLKLENERSVLVDNLKNKHLVPVDEVAKAFFDDKEVLWILVKDKHGKEVLKRADGNPIDSKNEFQYIIDAPRYPI
jgi:hypothetical protein